MLSLPRAAIVVAALSLTLTACGGSSDDSAADDTSAAGQTFTTDDFSYTAPEGWKDAESDATQGVLSLAVDSNDKDGFSDNINVVSENSIVDIGNLDDVAKSAQESLAAAGPLDVQVNDPVEIDGEEAGHIGALFDQNGTKYRTEQYFVAHGEAGYVITFSFSEDVPDATRDDVAATLLATWSWAD